MVQCDFCSEEFDDETRLHIHWGEEHEDEINSHQKEKVKKAEREKEQQKDAAMARRKRLAGYGLGGTVAILLIGFIALQVVQNTGGGPAATEDFQLDSQPVMSPSDNVTNDTIQIVEFGDYQCGHCQSFELNEKPQLKEQYLDNPDVDVEFYWINYPVLGPDSVTAAEASECVAEEAGRDSEEFWNFHTAMFETSDINYNADGLTQIARDSTSGLDYESINSCIADGDMSDEVDQDLGIGEGNEVEGTPTIFINEDRISGYNFGTIQAAIERKLP